MTARRGFVKVLHDPPLRKSCDVRAHRPTTNSRRRQLHEKGRLERDRGSTDHSRITLDLAQHEDGPRLMTAAAFRPVVKLQVHDQSLCKTSGHTPSSHDDDGWIKYGRNG